MELTHEMFQSQTTTCLALLQVAFVQQQPNNLYFTAPTAANPLSHSVLCVYVGCVCACLCVDLSEGEREQ